MGSATSWRGGSDGVGVGVGVAGRALRTVIGVGTGVGVWGENQPASAPCQASTSIRQVASRGFTSAVISRSTDGCKRDAHRGGTFGPSAQAPALDRAAPNRYTARMLSRPG